MNSEIAGLPTMHRVWLSVALGNMNFGGSRVRMFMRVSL